MKTRISKKLSALLVALFCLAAGFSAKAQVVNPYKITNNLPCSIKISYTIYKPTGPCTACSSGVLTIPASSGAPIPIPPGCLPACDIAITLTQVGGVNVFAPITVNMANPTGYGTCTDCPCTILNVTWTNGQTTFY